MIVMWLKNIFRPVNRAQRPRPGVGAARQVDVQLAPQALRQLERLRLRNTRDLPGEAIGQRRSSQRRPDVDFREHRAYVPGDDLRFVDWRASARNETVFMKQGEQTKEAVVFLLLDCSASMAWGEPPKNHAQLSLAAALGYLALARGDRLFVYPMGGIDNASLHSMRGKGQIANFLAYLRGLTFGGEHDLLESVQAFSRLVSLRGVVFLLSDLLNTTRLDKVLDYFPVPAWDATVFHILHPQELEPQYKGQFQLVDSETGAAASYNLDARAMRTYRQNVQAWQQQLALDCVEHFAFYDHIPADWQLAAEMLAHLRATGTARAL
jgi:uncharacterized protein (DUF58 family)